MTTNRYCWDSCVFIAWIKNEKPPVRKPGEMEGLASIVSEVERGEGIIVASSLVFSEVYEAKLTSPQKALFDQVLKRPSIYIQSADIRVCKLAAEIRDYYAKKRSRKLKVPDAIHLATAQISGSHDFHTFDEELIVLNEDIATPPLKICKPSAAQPSLL